VRERPRCPEHEAQTVPAITSVTPNTATQIAIITFILLAPCLQEDLQEDGAIIIFILPPCPACLPPMSSRGSKH
jgi:hypothetical protein